MVSGTTPSHQNDQFIFAQILSSQVINEFVAVAIKKNILPMAAATHYAKEFMDIFEFTLVGQETIRYSFDLMERYHLASWDSLIIASALEAGCNILYTEDLQDGQIIEGKLKIVNPFRKR